MRTEDAPPPLPFSLYPPISYLHILPLSAHFSSSFPHFSSLCLSFLLSPVLHLPLSLLPFFLLPHHSHDAFLLSFSNLQPLLPSLSFVTFTLPFPSLAYPSHFLSALLPLFFLPPSFHIALMPPHLPPPPSLSLSAVLQPLIKRHRGGWLRISSVSAVCGW